MTARRNNNTRHTAAGLVSRDPALGLLARIGLSNPLYLVSAVRKVTSYR